MKLNLIDELEARSGGIKVSDLAAILGVDDNTSIAWPRVDSFRVSAWVEQ